MDGDLQHKPKDIKNFHAFSQRNPDFAVGTRNLFKNRIITSISLTPCIRVLILIVNLLWKKNLNPMSGFHV